MVQGLNRHFTKEHVLVANKLMRRCSTALVIKETPIKTTIHQNHTRCHSAHIRMATVTKAGINSDDEGAEKSEPMYIGGGKAKWCPLESNLEVPPKLSRELAFDPAIPLLGIYSREMKMYTHAKTHSSIIHNSEKAETTQMCFSWRMDKQNVI